jgi:hypothetical protein
MRSSMLLLLAACAPCLKPQTVLNAIEFDMSGSLSSLRVQPEEADFPTALPANGLSRWVMLWDTATTGAVHIDIDGQTYEAEGSWDDVECGNFSLAFEGEYLGSDGGRHVFATDGEYNTYDGLIDGLASWRESWEDAAGAQGTLVADVVFRGESDRAAGE